MTLISYAQNFEDVMLHRALRNVTAGTYVDVGAHDPDEFSVTKLFYERGWRGINVEPVADYFRRLEAERPEDINLNVAAGAVAGTMEMFVIAGTGLSTFVKQHASAAAERGFTSVSTTVVVETLDAICARLPTPDLHFLKIDVEGAEGDVLRGIDLERFRPWIIVVEATRPGTPDADFEEWEPMLTARRYRFAYFDGLNRFYLAKERSTLAGAFASPPNVFDEFILSRQQVADRKLEDIDRWMNALPVADPVVESTDRVDRLRSRFGALIHLVERLTTDRSDLQSELEVARATRRDLEAELQQLRATLVARDAAIADLVKEGETTRLQYAETVATLRIAVSALEQQLAIVRERAASQVDELTTTLASANANVAALEQRGRSLDAHIEAVRRSRSWRITAPLRALTRMITGRD